MAGIVPALESNDDVSLFRQPIDDLAFPFVPPLGADDHNISHWGKPFSGSILAFDGRQPIRAAPESSNARMPGHHPIKDDDM
ncbi:hypothetical protein CRBSH125_26230 [Afipia carboxidovorans]|nr:hypothetical protein CRBSH125_26230 [Afipia carboxidovorans]